MTRIASNYYTMKNKEPSLDQIETPLGNRPLVTIYPRDGMIISIKGGRLQSGDKAFLRRAGVTCHKTRETWMITSSGNLYSFDGAMVEAGVGPRVERLQRERGFLK